MKPVATRTRRSFFSSLISLVPAISAQQLGPTLVVPDQLIEPLHVSLGSHEAELRIRLDQNRVSYFFLTLRPNAASPHYQTTLLEVLRRTGIIEADDPSRGFHPVQKNLGNQAIFEIVSLGPIFVQKVWQLPWVIPIKAEISVAQGGWWFGVGDASSNNVLVPGATNAADYRIGPQMHVSVILQQQPDLPPERRPTGQIQFAWSQPIFWPCRL